MDQDAELRMVRRKLQENHLNPEKCTWQDSCELDPPPSVSGRYLHLAGLATDLFHQKIVVSVTLHNTRVLYAFCKNFLTPSTLRVEVLNLVLQINARLPDAVLIYKPTKRQNLYLKQTVFLDPRVSEGAFGALLWKEMVRVTDTFKRELEQLAYYLGRFDVPQVLHVKRELEEIPQDQLRRLASKRTLESKVGDELLPERLPDSASVYSSVEYCSRNEMGAVQLAISAFEMFSRLIAKGIEPRPAGLSSFVFSAQFPKKMVALACSNYVQVKPREVKPEEFSSFLEIQGPQLTPQETFQVLSLCKIVFLRDLVLAPDYTCSSISRERSQYRLQPLFSICSPLKSIIVDYYLSSKACARLESSLNLHDGLVLFPFCASIDSWDRLGTERQQALQAQAWILQDLSYVPLASLPESAKRVEQAQQLLPKLVLELAKLHDVGAAHLRLTPRRVWVDPRTWDVQFTEICALRERFSVENLSLEDLPFIAPELLTSEPVEQVCQADVYSLAMVMCAFLFPSEILRYGSVAEHLTQVRTELRRPYIDNIFEQAHPEFTDMLRRSWEDKFRPELSKFVWASKRAS